MQNTFIFLRALRAVLIDMVSGPTALALLPVVLVLGVITGAEATLVGAAMLIICALVLISNAQRVSKTSQPRGALFARSNEGALKACLDLHLAKARLTGGATSCVLIDLKNFDDLMENPQAHSLGLQDTTPLSRLDRALRRQDHVFSLGEGRYGVALSPISAPTAETVLQIASRLQNALQNPLSDETPDLAFCAAVGVSISSDRQTESGHALLTRARRALSEARAATGPGIRLSAATPTPHHADPLRDEIESALESGEIQPWFQPQLSTDTGRISGVEALARWCHPTRGVIPPAQFLPVLEALSLGDRLHIVMLRAALGALVAWRAEGFEIPCVSINLSPDDLRDPTLVDRIAWELDHHDLRPHDLCIEILETVVSLGPDDVTTATIQRLAALGCRIDLDDFGTGHASIAALQRFPIARLKIDRSYIARVDKDPAQQRMVAAILSMSEQLGLDTLAEGVETQGEHAHIAQLGCGHVQGFGIARPMPFEKLGPWLGTYLAGLPNSRAMKSTGS
jgi:EAL domain-containing protein (putative c-di-GMP-specific phosphodiesterase class I)/GGDEF domain-containing protein